MPAFAYQATDATGREVSGSLEAPDRTTAVRQLTGRGLQPFKVAEAANGKVAKAVAAPKASAAKGGKETAKEVPVGPIKLGGGQVQLFTEELAELLEAGMRLEPALKLMEGKGEDSPHRSIARKLGDLVREGHPFSSALRAASPSFGELYCAVAAAGEAGGSLGSAMKRQAEYLSSVRELRSKVAVAMIYPGFLLVSAIGVTVLFATFLIPRLTVLLSRMKGGIPAGIQFVVNVSEFLKHWWWMLLIVLAALAGLFWLWTQSKAGRPVWQRTKIRLPFAGSVLMASFHSQFLETLASLTAGGLPLLRGLELASKVSTNVYIQAQLQHSIDLVRDGASLSRGLEKTTLFPNKLLEMIRIGEHTGEIAETLRRTADRCSRELGKAIERAMALLQPVIILLMAGLVGVMAYMMISVIFETVSALKSR